MTIFSDWDEYAECYDALTRLTPYQDMLEAVLAALTPIVTPVLDAGCGTGNVTQKLIEGGVGRSNIVAIDSSHSMLHRARTKLPATHFVHGDLNSPLPFADGTFGSIVCINALYAVIDPLYTLTECARVMKTKGSLIIVTPKAQYENGLILKAHAKSLKPDAYWSRLHASPERERILVHEAVSDSDTASAFLRLVSFNKQIAKSQSFHFFTKKELRDLVCTVGFTNVEIQSVYAEQNILLTAKKRNVP